VFFFKASRKEIFMNARFTIYDLLFADSIPSI